MNVFIYNQYFVCIVPKVMELLELILMGAQNIQISILYHCVLNNINFVLCLSVSNTV